jgi:hypothetical protein
MIDMEITEEAQIPHASLSGKECRAASRIGQELDWGVPGVEMNLNLFNGSLCRTVNESNGWSDPGGKGFMVRSCTYEQDSLKISGGEPLLKLMAVDWFKAEHKIDHVARQPGCCVQVTLLLCTLYVLLRCIHVHPSIQEDPLGIQYRTPSGNQLT